MLIRLPPAWQMPESAATAEDVFFDDRRRLLKTLAVGASVILAPGIRRRAEAGFFAPDPTPPPDPSADLYPAKRNPRYVLDRPLTPEEWATRYNNFYEFSADKRLEREARALKTRPWTVTIDGLVEKPITIDIDSLLRKMPLEERLYRHRCVEAWAIAVPWSGFPLKALVELARPLGASKFLRMETFLDRRMAPRQTQVWLPWPYAEGLTLAEATNELAFISTGAYGKPLPRQNGAPLRLTVPWKYGFKSIKSIVRFSFTEERPVGFWEKVLPAEYGFWANVNPHVPHPRWSQETETTLGDRKDYPTQIYNGYGAFVAHLYRGLEGERLFV